MLWNIIRDFIVEHITGGTTSNFQFYNPSLGEFYIMKDGYVDDVLFSGTGATYVSTNFFLEDVGMTEPVAYMSIGDWLATTITAIIMVLLVVFAVWLVRWIFKAVSSAFLLK